MTVSGQELPSDDELLTAMRADDDEAFRVFVRRYHQSLVRLASRHVSSAAIAEEVVQETWVSVIRGLDGFAGRSSVKTWLFTILVNKARSYGAREHRATSHASLDAADAGEGAAVDPGRFRGRGETLAGYWVTRPERFSVLPEEQLLGAETRELIARAITVLPVRQQHVISLRDIEGWSAAEVCELLQLSEANQRVLLHRARAAVRAALETHFAKLKTI
jgi:RNA polymerase sigma-70 factor (ECF subfamily)